MRDIRDIYAQSAAAYLAQAAKVYEHHVIHQETHPPVVWHAHHDSSSPLEFLNESFAERLETIKTEKAKEETPEQIKIRLKLFKPFKGKLPPALDKACVARTKARAALGKADAAGAYATWAKADAARDRAMQNAKPEIMRLHAQQCGCGWTPEKPNIFDYYEIN